jgi:membrane complex biogenesis BtpA family protein
MNKKIIGMIHLKTLPGYPNHKGMNYVIKEALKDLAALEKGGVDEILVENTEDHPHQKFVGAEVIAAMTLVVREIVSRTKLPVGVCVLWNDYRAALSIAKITGAKFVRIPVFADTVLTNIGIIEANPLDIISYRKRIKADNVKILADVQVKHAKIVVERPIEESALETLKLGADEIIITGRFTGDPPEIEKLKRINKVIPKELINIGSGINPKNIEKFAKYAKGFIVGTYFKTKGSVDESKVKKLVKKLKKLNS